MKICIPTEENNGLDSIAYGHFGSAPNFLIYDTVTCNYEILNNGDSNHEHGQCNPISPLLQKGVDAIVVGGMGARALMNLNSIGIQVFRTSDSMKIRDIVSNWDTNQMEELTMENSCNHHNCH